VRVIGLMAPRWTLAPRPGPTAPGRSAGTSDSGAPARDLSAEPWHSMHADDAEPSVRTADAFQSVYAPGIRDRPPSG
jgi:hypothetical protein